MREKEKTGVRDELAGLPVDRERLQEFNIILEKYKAGKKRLEKRVVAAEQWWKLRNEAEERKQNIGWDEGFRAKSGWLHNVIISKHADAMESYPEPIILPREPGDREQAKMLTAVIPVILTQNKFERIYSDVAWQKLKTGTGVYKVTWDADKLGGLGDIDISRVDLLSVFWEPGITDIQKSRYFFHCELQDNELLERQYPQLKDKLKGDVTTLTKFIYDDNVPTDGKSLVVDVYYKLPEGGRTVLHYCKYVGNEVLYSTENEAENAEFGVGSSEDPLARPAHGESWREAPERGPSAGPAGLSRLQNMPPADFPDGVSPQGEGRGMPGMEPSVGAAMPGVGAGPGNGGLSRTPAPTGVGPGPGAVMPGMGAPGAMPGMPGAVPAPVEHHGLYDHGLYPFVFDPLWPVEGSPCGYGYVDLSMNPQIQLDMLDTAFLKNAMVGATPRYFQRIDGAVNENEFLDLKKAIVHVSGNLDEQSLRVIDYKPLAGGYLNFYANKVAELRETSGNTETAQGISSGGVTAASAIAALQEASGKSSRDAIRSGYLAFAELTNLCVELVRQFYDLPRIFRIRGKAGEEFVSLDNSAMLPQPLGLMGEDLGYRLPVFDIRVEAQKRDAYTRTARNELALQLYGLGFFDPANAAAALSCLDMMDFEGREELTERLRAAAAAGPMPPLPGGQPGAEAEAPAADPAAQARLRSSLAAFTPGTGA